MKHRPERKITGLALMPVWLMTQLQAAHGLTSLCPLAAGPEELHLNLISSLQPNRNSYHMAEK